MKTIWLEATAVHSSKVEIILETVVVCKMCTSCTYICVYLYMVLHMYIILLCLYMVLHMHIILFILMVNNILYRWREESKTLTQKFEHTIAQLR